MERRQFLQAALTAASFTRIAGAADRIRVGLIGSGGRGQWNAGDGIRRTIRFLEKMDCTLLTGHRIVPPFGLAGGENGQVGQNSVRRKNGSVEKLKGCDATVIDAGEAIIIQTPTAGGYGEAG